MRRGSLAAVALGMALLAGCTRSTEPDRATVRPVSPPDLSGMSESVQRQIREGFAALTRTIDNRGTSAVDLGNAYGEMGRLFMAAQHLDEAESCFFNAQALAPNEVRWPYYLAQVYRLKNDPVKAAAFFERTLQIHPNDLPAMVYLGEVYLAQGRPEAAQPPLAKALALDPRLAVALFGLGRAALAQRDFSAAAQHLEKSLALDPRASSIHYTLAMAYRGLGDTAKAEAHAQQRGDSRPGFLPDPLMQQIEALLESAQAYEFRGTEALDRGEWGSAAAYLRKGVELAPNDSGVRLKFAEALRRSGHAEESLPHYEQTMKIDPRGTGARFGSAMALVRLHRYQEARDRLVEGMRVHPGQSAFPQALARLLASAPDAHVRDGRRALALIHEILKRDQSTESAATMAMTLAELGQFDEAVALQRQLIAAVQQAGREDLARIMVENLRLYERREACRTPWPDEAIP